MQAGPEKIFLVGVVLIKHTDANPGLLGYGGHACSVKPLVGKNLYAGFQDIFQLFRTEFLQHSLTPLFLLGVFLYKDDPLQQSIPVTQRTAAADGVGVGLSPAAFFQQTQHCPGLIRGVSYAQGPLPPDQNGAPSFQGFEDLGFLRRNAEYIRSGNLGQIVQHGPQPPETAAGLKNIGVPAVKYALSI